MWRSSSQKIEYMVVTEYYVDANWRLHKRVLSFFHLPPPLWGVEIADAIYRCCKEWGVEDKVYTISVDNVSKNDVAIRNLLDTFSRTKKLLCEGKLFHVRCYVHILNLMVQDGVSQILHIIENIRNSAVFLNNSEARLFMFADIVQQLQLPHRKLVIDYKTRWNSTYEMLSSVLKFKEVFPRYRDRGSNYYCCQSNEDWEKPEKLDRKYEESQDNDEFLFSMVAKMKGKFDKYWDECYLLMAIGAILEPRCKMRVIEFAFPKIYLSSLASSYIHDVRKALYELYGEYVAEYHSNGGDQCVDSAKMISLGSGANFRSSSSWSEFSKFVKMVEIVRPQKSDLDTYLEEGVYICNGDSIKFDALEWWRVNNLKYRILSKMARDVLAIPITTVASEAIFSVSGRIIDSYHASLSPDIVQGLICGGDWIRNHHHVKRKYKKEKKLIEVLLPIY